MDGVTPISVVSLRVHILRMDLQFEGVRRILAIKWLNTAQERGSCEIIGPYASLPVFLSSLPTSRGTGLSDDSTVADMEKLHIQMLSLPSHRSECTHEALAHMPVLPVGQ